MNQYLKSLEPNDTQSYIKKLTFTAGECLPDPYTLVTEEWEKNINKFADITRRDITEYLIEMSSLYTKESMKAYKSLEALHYFVYGQVQQCIYHDIYSACKFCSIKSKVRIKWFPEKWNNDLRFRSSCSQMLCSEAVLNWKLSEKHLWQSPILVKLQAFIL